MRRAAGSILPGIPGPGPGIGRLRQGTALAACALGLTLAVAAPPAAARGGAATPGAAAPKLSIETSPTTPKQGAIVALVARSDRPLTDLVLVQGDRRIPLEAAEAGRLFRGLVGIDLDAAAGRFPLRLEAAGAGGERVPVTYAVRVVSGRFRVRRLEVAPGYVDLPPEILERVREEQARVAEVWATGDPLRRWTGPFRQPVDAQPVANFGDRRLFNGQPRAPHNGIDFPAPEGAPVVAAAAARVALTGDLYFSGGTVILDHGAGLFTTYLHLSRIDVAAGELVEPGQPIGAVGATGRSTGPHLHWGARLHGARVNPLDLLSLPEWPLPAVTALP